MLALFYYLLVFYLSATELAFIVRMILSFVAPDAEGPIIGVIMLMTEIFTAPIRIFMEKHDILTGYPVDFAFFFGSLVVGMLLTILI